LDSPLVGIRARLDPMILCTTTAPGIVSDDEERRGGRSRDPQDHAATDSRSIAAIKASKSAGTSSSPRFKTP
jgi:hypothetical protein